MAYNTISLKGDRMVKEDVANATITPGQLVEFNSSNGKLQRHSTLKGNAMAMFAKEDVANGATISTNYSATNRIQYIIPCRGGEVYAQLTTSQTIKKGDFLVSSGDGNLQKFEIDSGENPDFIHRIVAMAMEDKTTTGATARIIVQVV